MQLVKLQSPRYIYSKERNTYFKTSTRMIRYEILSICLHLFICYEYLQQHLIKLNFFKISEIKIFKIAKSNKQIVGLVSFDSTYILL